MFTRVLMSFFCFLFLSASMVFGSSGGEEKRSSRFVHMSFFNQDVKKNLYAVIAIYQTSQDSLPNKLDATECRIPGRGEAFMMPPQAWRIECDKESKAEKHQTFVALKLYSESPKDMPDSDGNIFFEHYPRPGKSKICLGEYLWALPITLNEFSSRALSIALSDGKINEKKFHESLTSKMPEVGSGRDFFPTLFWIEPDLSSRDS